MKNISIKLSYDQAGSTLDEVVVVGYGVQKKSNVTGAISSVNRGFEDLQLPELKLHCRVELRGNCGSKFWSTGIRFYDTH